MTPALRPVATALFPPVSESTASLRKDGLMPIDSLPLWVPEDIRLYLRHTRDGLSLRELARREGQNASTVLRKVRRMEERRDDPLLDGALNALIPENSAFDQAAPQQESLQMSAPLRPAALLPDDATLESEARRILRRMSEPGAVLAFATDFDKAAVLREFPDGRVMRTAVMDRIMAQAFVLKGWISCKKAGKIASYQISNLGRSTLKALLGEDRQMPSSGAAIGFADAATAFHAPRADVEMIGDDDHNLSVGQRRRRRYGAVESPVEVLGRRRDKDGNAFIDPELVDAAERIRQDFELAQMGPSITQNWERFLSGPVDQSRSGSSLGEGSAAAARARVAAALRDLGPGLGEVVLRVCCYLEGIETAEQHMGWAARSGKIVLRIALQRLARHYLETYGRGGPMIG
jgi:hypothetical protein